MRAVAWKVDATQILTKGEIVKVIASLKRRGRRSVNARMNLALFRLATCCGLRVTEACGLRLSDLRAGIPRPYINVPKNIAKGHRARRVPLWWDQGTLDDLLRWKMERMKQGAAPGDYLLCAQSARAFGHRLSRVNARLRFISSCRALGEDRQRELTIHHGRHSFVSHALVGGRSLAEVRDAAGHSNISTTSIYTHVAVQDDGSPGDLFSE